MGGGGKVRAWRGDHGGEFSMEGGILLPPIQGRTSLEFLGGQEFSRIRKKGQNCENLGFYWIITKIIGGHKCIFLDIGGSYDPP